MSGMSSQGWTGNSETARTPGRAWRRLASAISPAMGWSSVPWPSAGTSMGARAKSVTGRISPRTVLQEEGGRLRAGLVEVDVRVRVVADQGVGLLDHPGRDRGVKVQRRDERNGGADGLADRGEELALAVRRVLEHHRAVEREEHAVDGPGRGQPLEERVPHVIEGRPRHRPRRDRVGRDRRDHLDAGGFQHVEEAAHLGPGAAEARDELVSVEKLGGPEVLEVRALADEGVGLLHELPDRDPHWRRRSHLAFSEPSGGASGVA